MCKDGHPTTLSCTKRKKKGKKKKNFNTRIFLIKVYVCIKVLSFFCCSDYQDFYTQWCSSGNSHVAGIHRFPQVQMFAGILQWISIWKHFFLRQSISSVSEFLGRWCIVADSSSEIYPAARNCSVGTLEVHSRLSSGLARCVFGMNCRIIPTIPYLFTSLVALM